MNKEEQLLQKRLIELSYKAYQRNIATYSDFLNLHELNILHSIPKSELYSNYQTFGGYEYAERQMVTFLPDALCFEQQYPIAYLKVEPIQKKFSDILTHRDFLGAVLNLGIERSKLGDILLTDTETIVICHTSLVTFIQDELTRIKHTSVMVQEIAPENFTYQPKFKEITGSVSSLRLDSLLALAFSASRSKLVTYIENGKVFVNGKLITSNGYQIKEDDIISVRGLGRFQYKSIINETKKGRYMITIHLYI